MKAVPFDRHGNDSGPFDRDEPPSRARKNRSEKIPLLEIPGADVSGFCKPRRNNGLAKWGKFFAKISAAT